jgi:hypothetical protein
MDVWTALDFTWCEGGSVVGVAGSLDAAKGICEREYRRRGRLEWSEKSDGEHWADQGESPKLVHRSALDG